MSNKIEFEGCAEAPELALSGVLQLKSHLLEDMLESILHDLPRQAFFEEGGRRGRRETRFRGRELRAQQQGQGSQVRQGAVQREGKKL